jgi:DNA topoisomerase I
METTERTENGKSPEEVARAAGLRYVVEGDPGITRVTRGRGFSYHAASGSLIKSAREKDRLRSLAIPPAWTEVWICPHSDGHIQATGRDSEGRKQYRYHPDWMEARSHDKFQGMLAFGGVIPRIRRRVRRDLRRPGMPREKLMALLVRLLDLTGIRIGNPTSGSSGSYGLTTLRRRHVAFQSDGVCFRFRGKGGKAYDVCLSDPGLASVLQSCHEIPGHELFQFVGEDGERHTVSADDVNDYLRRISRADITSKDFRTWVGSVQALIALEALPSPSGEAERRANIAHVLELVSQTLRNTPAVSRDFYVHPLLLDAYLDGTLPKLLRDIDAKETRELRVVERRFLALLEATGSE